MGPIFRNPHSRNLARFNVQIFGGVRVKKGNHPLQPKKGGAGKCQRIFNLIKIKLIPPRREENVFLLRFSRTFSCIPKIWSSTSENWGRNHLHVSAETATQLARSHLTPGAHSYIFQNTPIFVAPSSTPSVGPRSPRTPKIRI